MASDIEVFIAQNCPWDKLPNNIKKLLGNTQKEYEKHVVEYSIKTQQKYVGNLVQHIVKNQKVYYEDLVTYSRSHLMMFPYHLSDVVVRGLRLTPFQYYVSILGDIMTAEKSYDSLPNFTAADCLRLLGIGRNQYIDLMNQCRSSRKLFRRKNARELLPVLPIEINIEHWWIVHVGSVTEDDVKNMKPKEKSLIDRLIDSGPQTAGTLPKEYVHTLYSKGLIYLSVPINDSDCLSVPPLEGFVMNRILGDYLESLMYKIFVSIDQQTPVCELSKVLQIDLNLVKIALSLFCRLGFAHKKNGAEIGDIDPSWNLSLETSKTSASTPTTEDFILEELESALAESIYDDSQTPSSEKNLLEESLGLGGLLGNLNSGRQRKRIAFLYDSTLTAFLMMGNLSPGLKNHAVTMFEMGKMLDEGLDSLLSELDKIQRSDSEGEAQRYFEHALTLRTTISFLRQDPERSMFLNKDKTTSMFENCVNLDKSASETSSFGDCCEDGNLRGSDLGVNEEISPEESAVPPALDLIRWESLSNLEPATTARLLSKNYKFLVSMAPLSYEIPPVVSGMPPHFGPQIPEVNSVWFKLYIYSLTQSGPASLLLPKGYRLHTLPPCLNSYQKVLITPWGHDPTVVPTSIVLLTVNDALMHSPVFIQAYGWYHDVCVQHIPLPLEENGSWQNHIPLKNLSSEIDLSHTFGFLKMISFPNNLLDSDYLHSSTEIRTGVPTMGEGSPSIITHVKCSSETVEIPQIISFDDMSTIEEKNLSIKTGQMDIGSFMLLDLQFGLPLFDAALNAQVSKLIVERGIFNNSNITKYMESSRNLVKNLTFFIESNYSVTNTYNVKSASNISADAPSCLPMPTTPLLFDKGVLIQWRGL